MFWRRKRDDAAETTDDRPEIDLEAQEPDPADFDVDEAEPEPTDRTTPPPVASPERPPEAVPDPPTEPEAQLGALARAAAMQPLFADADADIEIAMEQGLERTRGSFMTRLRDALAAGPDGPAAAS